MPAHDNLGGIVAMRMDEPDKKLAAAVVKQALIDGCDPKDPQERAEARAWFQRAESVFIEAVTTATVTPADIAQMAEAVFDEWDEQVQRRYEVALRY